MSRAINNSSTGRASDSLCISRLSSERCSSRSTKEATVLSGSIANSVVEQTCLTVVMILPTYRALWTIGRVDQVVLRGLSITRLKRSSLLHHFVTPIVSSLSCVHKKLFKLWEALLEHRKDYILLFWVWLVKHYQVSSLHLHIQNAFSVSLRRFRWTGFLIERDQ